MATILAVYRGNSIASAKLIAATSNPDIVEDVAARLLCEPETDDGDDSPDTAEGDEHWFRLHPDAGERDRPVLRHEMAGLEPGMDRVIVRRVRAGEFIRRAYQSKKGSA